jgi:hypothetical protein
MGSYAFKPSDFRPGEAKRAFYQRMVENVIAYAPAQGRRRGRPEHRPPTNCLQARIRRRRCSRPIALLRIGSRAANYAQ